MAEQNNGQAPDLQTILATLASFGPPVQPDVSTTEPNSHDLQVSEEQTHRAPLPRASETRIRSQGRSTVSPKPVVDPATITTWQDGLRCVTKIAAQNTQFPASIRKMMENQRQNEMRWYAERQALKQSQASRERAAAQTSQILKTLGNDEGATAATRSIEEELAKFDCKIYAAQVQMDVAMTEELKGLGVPFFGTDTGAIVEEESMKDAVQAANSRPKHSPLVTENELLTLRRRMVEHLEALYRD